MGGAKFAANVAGNPMQEANLKAAISALGGDAPGFNTMLDLFRAQGRNPTQGAATAFNINEAGNLGGGGLLGMLTNPLGTARNVAEAFRSKGAAERLADYLSDPKSPVQALQDAASANGSYDPYQQQLLINLLQANPTTNALPDTQSQ